MPAAAGPATWASPRPAGWPTTTPSGATPTTSPASSPTCARPTRTCIASWATSPNCWTTDRTRAAGRQHRARARRGPTEQPPHDFLDKVAYGSDWHMPSMVDNTELPGRVRRHHEPARLCRASRPVLPRHGDGVPEALKRSGPGASGLTACRALARRQFPGRRLPAACGGPLEQGRRLARRQVQSKRSRRQSAQACASS